MRLTRPRAIECSICERRDRLSNHVGNAERRKSNYQELVKRADAAATDDARFQNRIKPGKPGRSARKHQVDEATQEQESARKALASAEKRYKVLGGK